MWASLVLTAVSLSPAQADGLTLTNIRATHGAPGIARKDNKLLPGDHVFVAFDIEGITVDKDGKVLYSMTTEVLDPNGKSLFRQDPRDLEVINALGGQTVPAYTQLDVGVGAPAGQYTLKVTVTDRATKQNQSFSRNFDVLPKAFGLVRLTTTLDQEAKVPVAAFATGETLWVNGALVGFERGDKQPNLNVELRVLDAKGEPTVAKPFTGVINKDVPATALSVPVQFLVPLNRAGEFTVQLKATDKVSGKTTEISFPLTVSKSR